MFSRLRWRASTNVDSVLITDSVRAFLRNLFSVTGEMYGYWVNLAGLGDFLRTDPPTKRELVIV
jgi:hypothetical protein